MILAQKGLEPFYLNALDVGAGLAFAHVSDQGTSCGRSYVGIPEAKKGVNMFCLEGP